MAYSCFGNTPTQKFVACQVIDEDLLFPGHRPRFNMNESEDLPSSLQNAIDIVNHSRLTRAWHEMLTSRWISASITSVLPFYLSAIFHSFRALPALEILSSPSSLSPFPLQRFQQLLDPEPFRHLRHATVKDDAESSVTWLPKHEAPPHFIPSQASMHLARMVAIVASCKEAIWGAYNKLYCEDPRPPRPNDALGRTNISTMRDEFEHYWSNWEWLGFFSTSLFSPRLMMMCLSPVTCDHGLICQAI